MLRLLEFFSAGRRTDERYGRGVEGGKETSARDAKHKWARVWCRTRPAPRNFARGGVAAHRAWRQRNASAVVRRNINHIGMVVYGVYAIGLQMRSVDAQLNRDLVLVVAIRLLVPLRC